MIRRLRAFVFGTRGATIPRPGGVTWSYPGTAPVWRRYRKPKPLPPGWRSVGYTMEDQ